MEPTETLWPAALLTSLRALCSACRVQPGPAAHSWKGCFLPCMPQDRASSSLSSLLFVYQSPMGRSQVSLFDLPTTHRGALNPTLPWYRRVTPRRPGAPWV